MHENQAEKRPSNNFIRNMVNDDMQTMRWDGKVITRFPPEPNGYLHIGHAKSICLNFGLAKEFNGTCHLRFDDTNPLKESEEYVESIKRDVKWLGFDWGKNLFFTSDYFEELYQFAIQLIKKDKAFVCELNAQEMREYRGNLKDPGKESPHRNRSIGENLDLFERMRAGEFEDGKYTLRAKIDMNHPNINMRDPAIYRIRRFKHHRTGDEWPIYPMYDYAHCVSDSLEKITHSLCTLEFEDHRPLYDWFLDELEIFHSRQTEFARLNLEYTVMSKRKLLQLVQENHVKGWDDPRMPTISGMRRRGFTPASIRNFCELIGVTKKSSSIAMSTLESAVRDDLNLITPRVFGVTRPLKVVIENYPAGDVQEIECPYHPQDESFGKRMVAFTREIYIEQDDFMENPPKKYFRLKPGGMVRLRYGYVIECKNIIRDDKTGAITELRCDYHPETFGGNTPEGMKKVKGIINWVSASESIEAELRLYDRLFKVPNPGSDKAVDFLTEINPHALEIIPNARVERALKTAKVDDKFQFERQGYFRVDEDSSESKLVFNLTMTLRDTWAKMEQE